ncbi:hypothetical protein A3K29_01195 [Candidatus Collierbacteria bacterium RIFOXYB2_FULL_46_14]|uniref:Uncharacterized protein n=1 Tax=Candidatus Collierbacteria bacterium GW2011_GWA2_46_26 TaxID=1618381 RepID=A0A0G1RS43_9BACT|nr:MAG: hypothetical protein UW29_C0009G0021 [Candidatus Collierbacteria bacterium GW2011_GWC2_44_13]KKU32768.1 MAG: hypothetical protein UX47_C0007G0012 [Candidatus Collierbacteria bacterium GW2011_GWA2_46_26]OGD72747.1 MAG: hypothetical protein A3K29_01195 [Candidatus Collierbacteria bacterium RIFOXYB2_FULL_46_14]OGD75789.1 MAG: hypothetical protein A3K43_01195 [Candidatus Collierbacteria bacterium RIFOXYA2_FULL_46_20]OGD77125.1 MAG: hypothetical protein A3K39_01195 [Candidatus Collierbacteri
MLLYGFLILLGSIVLLVLDIKLIMENDKTNLFLKMLGGLFIPAIFWINVLNFGANFLPTLLSIPGVQAVGPIIGIILVIGYIFLRITLK